MTSWIIAGYVSLFVNAFQLWNFIKQPDWLPDWSRSAGISFFAVVATSIIFGGQLALYFGGAA